MLVLAPLEEERFVKGEPIHFALQVPAATPVVPSSVQWTSSQDGLLGAGLELTKSGLSVGAHTVTVTGAPGGTKVVRLRVYSDLWQLYQAEPSDAERARGLAEFLFYWKDDPPESWSDYAPFSFNPGALDPSKAAVLAKLDVLRHQRFAKPLPFTTAPTALEHIRAHVHSMAFRLDCSSSYYLPSGLSFGRLLSVWYLCCSNPPQASQLPQDYIGPLSLLVHEARHAEPDDPVHNKVACNGNASGTADDTLEGGSGYAQAALYLMWVYKHSLSDSWQTRQNARQQAQSLLQNRFCTTPTHSNPDVQAIIDELLP